MRSFRIVRYGVCALTLMATMVTAGVYVIARSAAIYQLSPIAQTTVATILTRLEKRRIVKHQNKGRLFVYKATVTEPQVRRSMVSDLTELLFDGSPAALISHLLAEKEIDPRDLDEVKRLIADAERAESDVR